METPSVADVSEDVVLICVVGVSLTAELHAQIAVNKGHIRKIDVLHCVLHGW